MKAFKTIFFVLMVGSLLVGSAIAGDQQELSNPKIDLYGYIKLDASYENGVGNAGDYARWVDPGDPATGSFYMTARQTRFGWNFVQPEYENKKVDGKLEFDFYGGGADNKYLLMFRHAFVKIHWIKQNFEIIAGQTSDIISPLVPNTVNYSVAWWAGDIGYRRPQLRLGWTVGSGSTNLNLIGAATRPIGGENEGQPAWQGRAAVSFKLAGRKAELGVSGHTGKEADYKSYSGNFDVSLPLGNKTAFTAEGFWGKNMDAYLGGINQGVNDSTGTEIESQGGWAALSFGPFNEWSFNLGGSMDDPKDEDLETGMRSRNTSIWANCYYNITQTTVVAYEISRWETQYLNESSWDSYRNQLAFIFKF
jgi:hypothetical protein